MRAGEISAADDLVSKEAWEIFHGISDEVFGLTEESRTLKKGSWECQSLRLDSYFIVQGMWSHILLSAVELGHGGTFAVVPAEHVHGGKLSPEIAKIIRLKHEADEPDLGELVLESFSLRTASQTYASGVLPN